MNAMRTSRTLIRLVLAWFVLSMGVAVASPMVHPKLVEIICAPGGSVKMMVMNDDGTWVETGKHSMDCSLCLPVALPPSAASFSLDLDLPLARALQPMVAAHIAALVGAPMPPRGPPRIV
jgi:hypothetical protein